MVIPAIPSTRTPASSLETRASHGANGITTTPALNSDPTGNPCDTFVGSITNSIWSLGQSLVSGVAHPRSVAASQETDIANNAKTLRAFDHDLVAASGVQGDASQRAQAVKEVLAGHPEVLLWIAEGKDISAIARAADLPTLPNGTNPVLAALPGLGDGIQNAWSTLESYSALTYSLSAARSYYSALPEGSLLRLQRR